MTRLPDYRAPLSSRLHFSENAIEQFKKDSLHCALVCSNTWKELHFTFEPEGVTHIFKIPCILPVLFIGRNNIRCRCIRTEGLEDRTCFAECLRTGTIDHYNETQHSFRENFPHEVKTFLPRCTEQVEDQIFINRNATKIHRHCGGFLNGAFSRV